MQHVNKTPLKFVTNFKDKFSYNNEGNIIVAEISTLQLRKPSEQITIVSQKTGETVLFTFTNVDTWMGDIQGWNYTSDKGIKLLIIND